jgi:hypothetical protein
MSINWEIWFKRTLVTWKAVKNLFDSLFYLW